MPKKTSRVYAWLFVDKNRKEVVDIKVSRSRDFMFIIMCTDGYEVYKKHMFSKKHVVSKAETSLVESKNSLIRHCLARFNRRTKRYSKALYMIANSLLFN